MLRVFAAIGVLFSTASALASEVFPDAPDVIVCRLPAANERAAADIALYAARRYEDGSVLYRPLGRSQITATWTPDNAIEVDTLRRCRPAGGWRN